MNRKDMIARLAVKILDLDRMHQAGADDESLRYARATLLNLAKQVVCGDLGGEGEARRIARLADPGNLDGRTNR